MIFYAITLCFIMFICPFVGPLIWTNKILSYLILSYRNIKVNFYLLCLNYVQIKNLTSCFGLMTDSALVDAALRKSGLISN